MNLSRMSLSAVLCCCCCLLPAQEPTLEKGCPTQTLSSNESRMYKLNPNDGLPKQFTIEVKATIKSQQAPGRGIDIEACDVSGNGFRISVGATDIISAPTLASARSLLPTPKSSVPG